MKTPICHWMDKQIFVHHDNTYLLNIMVHESNSSMVLYITEYPM